MLYVGVPLWFDEPLCAGGCPEQWVAYGLKAYIWHDGIRLVPPEDPFGFLGRGGSGWMTLENIARLHGGYVRFGDNVVRKRNNFATREDCVREAFRYLSGVLCAEE